MAIAHDHALQGFNIIITYDVVLLYSFPALYSTILS